MKNNWILILCAWGVFLNIQLIKSEKLPDKSKREKESIPLDGIWSFKLDPMNVSIPVKGSDFTSRFPEEITLPGSTDQAGKGYKTQDMTSIRLTRMFEYCGAAWYEKSNVFIPENWKDKEIYLFFERAHWETKAWVNGYAAGREESLSVPHVYHITPYVRYGEKNVIRLRVDNSLIYDVAYTHAISAETQTNWNGIIGEMTLRAFDKVHIRDIQVYPQRKEKNVKLSVEVFNTTGQNVQGRLVVKCKAIRNQVVFSATTVPFQGKDSLFTVNFDYQLGNELFLWDEFDPNLYELTCTLSTPDNRYADETSLRFGIRDFGVKGTQFTVNDRPTFIRGAVNSCEFPITGYPPMDDEEWARILKVYKDYGLNNIRFHSWCPPEAAFKAADELGLYLQVENPDWRFTVGDDEATNQFYFKEAEKIFKTYGNHPSFAFFCEGNELVGKGRDDFLKKMLKQWKTDPRRLYVAASGYPNIEGSDFYDYYGARPQRWQEGLKGRFNSQPLNTLYDYSEYVAKQPIPMITHEIGQWCAYPDFRQIAKYTGVLKPYNYELFKEGLREKNMLDQAEDFHIASGKFQVIQKKEEFESYFRTPAFGGYHLLQLNDFPGQGTSPVGVVDVFYDPKTYVDAEEFRRMQNPQMLLLRMEKFTWTTAETLAAEVQFVNFGKNDIQNALVRWSMKRLDGTIYAEGDFPPVTAPVGLLTPIAPLSLSLNKVTEATAFDLTLSLTGTDIYNRWRIWVYPEQLPEISVKNVLITGKWDKAAKKRLEQGGRVLLLADTSTINSDVPPGFSGISWNAVWSGTPPNLLGILCNPAHEVFRHFPTEYHSNWQWFDLVRHSRPMLIDHTPYSFKPLVQMIPDWNNNRKIGLLLEAKIGNGKLLMTCIDFKSILPVSPVARQMYYSLLQYVVSDCFNPEETLTTEMIDRIVSK
jgi:hypothetical protein